MKQIACHISLVCLIFAVPSNLFARDYYVNNSHSLARNHDAWGRGPGTPWKTISYAASWSGLRAGDVIWVKAGSYGFGHEDLNDPAVAAHRDEDGVVVKVSGVTFRGYHGSELNPQDGVLPDDPIHFESQPISHWTSQFPTIFGKNRVDEFDGFAVAELRDENGNKIKDENGETIKITRATIRNFIIRGFKTGIWLDQALDSDLYNCLMVDLGDAVNASEPYHGWGVSMWNSGGSKVEKCTVMNAQAEGFSIRGANHNLIGCEAYSYRTLGDRADKAGTDYCFILNGRNTTGNVLRGCLARIYMYTARPGEVSLYSGHCFTLSSIPGHDGAEPVEVKGNTIIDCTAIAGGHQFEFRGPNTFNNSVINCLSENAGHAAVVFIAGPHNNEITRLQTHGVVEAIRTSFHATPRRTRAGDVGFKTTAGDIHSNNFRNCAFQIDSHSTLGSVFRSIREDSTGGPVPQQSYRVRNNGFFNCSFAGECTGSVRPHVVDSSGTSNLVEFVDNTFVNCIFNGFADYETSDSNVFTAKFDHCCFWNPMTDDSVSPQIFEPTEMEGATVFGELVADPLLLDTCWRIPGPAANDPIKTSDLHISSKSPVIGKGLSRYEMWMYYGLTGDLVDIDGQSGPGGEFVFGGARYDIGCDEIFNSSPPLGGSGGRPSDH